MPAPEPVEIYTDGSSRGNPGPGGWAALLRFRGHEREIGGREAYTTNNRMELLAAIQGLEALRRPCRVRVVTDSTYVRDGITRWLAAWKRRGWRTAGGQPVKNVDLWQRLETAASGHDVRWVWTRGHSGHPDNERVDRRARSEAAAVGSGRAAESRPARERAGSSG